MTEAPWGEAKAGADLSRLTPRERECLELVAQHWRTKDIARRLSLSPRTVDGYVASSVRKLGLGDRYAAARMMLQVQAGRAPPPPAQTTASAGSRPGRGLVEALTRALWLAGRISLMAGAAVAGLLLMMKTLDNGFDGRFDLLSVLSQLVWPGVLLACGVALWKGGRAERLATGAYLVAVLVTQIVWRPPTGVQYEVMAVDLALALVLALLAWRFDRPRLMVAAACHCLGGLTHLGALIRPDISIFIYLSVAVAWSCVALAAIVWSAFDRDPRPDVAPGI